MPRVFISYQRESETEAVELNRRLKEAGFEVWQDIQNIRHVDLWAEAINAALNQADRMILLLTPKAMESAEVFKEWFFFYKKLKRPLHCLMIERCQPHYQIAPLQYLNWQDAQKRDWNRLFDELKAPPSQTLDAWATTVTFSEFAPPRTEDEALDALLQAVRDETGVVALNSEQIKKLTNRRPTNLTEYRLARIAEWSKPEYQLDDRFVRLKLLVDQGEDAEGNRWEEDRDFNDLGELLTEIYDPAVVVLGAPGSGKSTLLRRLELNLATQQIRNNSQQVSFFIQISQYKPATPNGPLPSPVDWLATRWAKSYPELPPLPDLLREGRMILLLDAVNEMPHTNQDYYDRIELWKQFLQEEIHPQKGNRVVFSCRSLDYSSPLSTNELPVPQIKIEPMDDLRFRQFLNVYLPEHEKNIWNELNGSPQLDLFRTPYLLKLLVDQVQHLQQLPKGRAGLFTRFVRQAMSRERKYGNPLFKQDKALLTDLDVKRLDGAQWKNDYDLPDRGSLVKLLSQLAFRMQERLEAEGSHIRIDIDEVAQFLDHADSQIIVQAGLSLNVLDEDLKDYSVLFFHQLLQEFFAARKFALQPDPDKVRVEWRADLIDPSLEMILTNRADSDPLPPPPTTGWEETTILAAAMSSDQDKFVRTLMDANLVLAARCAGSPDVTISPALKSDLQQALLNRIADGSADLRVRIATALALGNLGDPRFERCSGPHGTYLLPPMVVIPAGDYPIGDDHSENIDEKPMHTIHLDTFEIGAFPVTNAEYKLFIDAGGYQDERWWQTSEANHWRIHGSDTEEIKEYWRGLQRRFPGTKTTEDDIRELLRQQKINPQEAEDALTLIGWTDERLEEWVNKTFSSDPRTQPRYWNDSNYNNPAQPVIGVCWYEALAYCAWLSAQPAGEKPFRLLTEVEFEAAARGLTGRKYPYGDTFDATRSNSVESHVRRTSPIGVFHNATPEGVYELSGNVWTWTSTAYKPYPYDANDGRENLTGEVVARVEHGGAFYYRSSSLRAACRSNDLPDNAFDDLGFRCARSVVNASA
jgi:formylglycine-generating enzyme required for sulfatase activity